VGEATGNAASPDRDLVIGHDVGTGGNKAVLADVRGKLLATAFHPYEVGYPRPGWAEQDPSDWWDAVCTCTRRLLEQSGASPGRVLGMGFAGQMADTVPVDGEGEPLTPAVIWLDSRADRQAEHIIRRLGGRRVLRRVAGALPTGKDLVSKWLWFKQERPDLFSRTAKFLDATGWLVFRATGVMQVDRTGAGASGIFDPGRGDWNPLFLRLLGLPRKMLPDVKNSTTIAGTLTGRAAEELGLRPDTPVISGMSDIPAAAIGSGALEEGDAHVNLGTSGWLVVPVKKAPRLGRYGMVSLPSADPELLIMIGETETAGACLGWLADILEGGEGERGGARDFSRFDREVEKEEPGAGGLIFCPWMFGERSPVPDTTLRAAFLNLSLEHRREHLLQAVYEGVALNLRWLVEAASGAGLPCRRLRAIGGGARSDAWMQVLADVTGREVEAVEDPQEAGAMGAALAAAVAAGAYRDIKEVKRLVRVRRLFTPRPGTAAVYDKLFDAFRRAYPALSRLGASLNLPET